jgi:acyl-CoA thioester hydrolase
LKNNETTVLFENKKKTIEETMLELPITYRGTVYPWHCDHMGHMNVMWYVGKFDEATWQLLPLLGLSTAFLRQHNHGMAAIEQHIAYKRELHAGDIVTIRSGILEMKEKVIRFFHEMRNQETNEISAITVLTGIHIDLRARKSCPFPEDILARGSEMIIDYDPRI